MKNWEWAHKAYKELSLWKQFDFNPRVKKEIQVYVVKNNILKKTQESASKFYDKTQ